MAKNKKFIKRYVVTVEGITTNNSASDFIENFLKVALEAAGMWYKQVDVSIRDYNEEPVEKQKQEKA